MREFYFEPSKTCRFILISAIKELIRTINYKTKPQDDWHKQNITEQESKQHIDNMFGWLTDNYPKREYWIEITKIERKLGSLQELYLEYVNNSFDRLRGGMWLHVKLEHLISFGADEEQVHSIQKYEAFAIFLAAKSILGRKKVCKTTWELLLARSMGHKSTKTVPPALKETDIWKQYTTRSVRKRLMDAMEIDWHIIYYSKYLRGFYIARQEYGIECLVEYAERKRKSYISKLNNARKKTAHEKAIKKIEDEFS
jgi:hypothetical protein